MRSLITGFLLVWVVTPVMAQTSDGNYYDVFSPSTASVVKLMHTTIQRNLAEAAESMPAEAYSFKPTPQVRAVNDSHAHIEKRNMSEIWFPGPIRFQ
jgi:hypothetical protein